MALKDQIQELVETISLPGIGLTLSQLNFVQGVEILDKTIKITLASSGLSQARQAWLKTRIENETGKLISGAQVEIEFKEIKPTDLNRIKKVVAVISGKGGVGKSLVSGLLAVSLSRLGHSVGILDADITGPSIPRMFGLDTRPEGTEGAILPVVSKTGIEAMSLNLILPEEDEAVIWRGPVITRVIRQFWDDVLWGKRDYLIIDLPPGTSDAPLTVMQQFPIDGVVIVFTPQALGSMIVRKTVKMAQQMHKPIVGVVENMSYLYIPEMNKNMEIFGPSKAHEMSESAKAPLLAKLPIDPLLTKLCDEGRVEDYKSEVVEQLGHEFLKSMKLLENPEKTQANPA
jgi:Mrp family chromosome partitioning ATPase